MGDSIETLLELQNRLETLLELQNRRDAEEYARDRLLGEPFLDLDEDSIPWILNHVDCFFYQSRGNESIEEMSLCPYSVNIQDYEVWDKVGRAIGNLQALKRLHIARHRYYGDEDLPIFDWEILARILNHVRQSITIYNTDVLEWDAEESRLFARAIHGHPTITSFEDGGNLPQESLDAFYSALATLPALESVSLCRGQMRPEDESALAHPEGLEELLRVPSLRSVCFDEFYFTSALCQATANALMEGAAITDLKFTDCSFSAGECAAILANGLSRNTSMTYIKLESTFDVALIGALAAVLPLNSTCRELVLRGSVLEDDPDFSPFLLALGMNTGLNTLTLGAFGLMDESLSTAMKDGLGMNETLESLELKERLCNENTAMWCNALSFLRTNRSLKSLMVTFDEDSTKSCFDALCRHIAAMLQENVSLESLSIGKHWTNTMQMKIKAEEYFSLVTALQHNTTLKSLNLYCSGSPHLISTLTDDEDMQMAALLKKNYALDGLPGISLKNRASDVGAILRLNGAGRRYLVQDGSSILKGVEVLSRVKNDINCVFLHLSENPRLCDRSAVEIGRAGEI